MTTAAPLSRSVDASHSLYDLIEQLTERLNRQEPVDLEAVAAEHPQHADELRKVWPSLAILADLRSADGRSALSFPPGSNGAGAAPTGELGDYRIVREIGRGGMGVVYEAEQISLGRRVALKVLPFAGVLDERQLARFKNEALAAAQLSHPHIVDVYGVGCERGVHYYTMRLIDGVSLQQLIGELRQHDDAHRKTVTDPAHQPEAPARDLPSKPEALARGHNDKPPALARGPDDGPAALASDELRSPSLTRRVTMTAPAGETPRLAALSTDPARRREYFRHIAQLGIDAAEALHHAHEQGVVHRDVKPSNLMLDGRGKVWVTDFGLAQVETGATLTMSGELIGTLRYMSPEQATGQRLGVDHRTDVYSLGATLYELLTLQPAFDGETRAELLQQILFQEPRPLRKVRPDVPVDLETIVLKAMWKLAAERYASADEMAEDLRRFAKGDAIKARKPTLRQKAARWARRRWAVLTTAAACVTVATIVVAAILVHQVRERAVQEAQLAIRANAAINEAILLQRRGETAGDDLVLWSQAVAAAKQAEAITLSGPTSLAVRHQARELRTTLQQASDAAQMRLAERDADRRMLADLDAAGMMRVQISDHGLGFETPPEAYTHAFRDYGIDLDRLSVETAAERIRTHNIRAQLIEALLDCAFFAVPTNAHGDTGRLLEIAYAASTGEPTWHQPVILALRDDDFTEMRRLADAARNGDMPSTALRCIAKALQRQDEIELARSVLEAAWKKDPGDFWVNVELGLLLADMPLAAFDEAIPYLTAAVALRPDSPTAHYNLGFTLEQSGNRIAAMAACRRAIELNPDYARALQFLGVMLTDAGDLIAAIAAIERAIVLTPDDPAPHNSLGIALEETGNRTAAIAAYQRAIELEPDSALLHNNLGKTLARSGDPAGAIAAFQRAIALAPDDAEAHSGLGYVLTEVGELNAAIAEHRRAIELRPDDAVAHNNLGSAFAVAGDQVAAIAEYRRAIELQPDYFEPHHNLAKAYKKTGDLLAAIEEHRRAVELKPDHAEAHLNLGYVLMEIGESAAAVAEYRRALELKPDYVEAHLNLGTAYIRGGDLASAIAEYRRAIELKPDYADAHYSLGFAYRQSGDPAAAIAAYQRAIELHPDHAGAHLNLGNIFVETGEIAAAVAQYQRAIELKPDSVEAYLSLGTAHAKAGDPAAAVAECRRAIELKPDFAAAHYCLGNAHDQSGDPAAAVAAYQRAIELHPDFAEAHCNLGRVLQRCGTFSEALVEVRRGHELGSRNPRWPYPSAHWVAEAERLVQLDRLLTAVIADNHQPASAGERIELAEFCLIHKRLHARAASLYGDAFAADPSLGEDLRTGRRYNAACAALLAATSTADTAVSNTDRTAWREASRQWLSADLAAWKGLAAQSPAPEGFDLHGTLTHWLQDPDLAGIRDPESLAQLPDAERNAWEEFWNDVRQLLGAASQPVAEGEIPPPPSSATPQ